MKTQRRLTRRVYTRLSFVLQMLQISNESQYELRDAGRVKFLSQGDRGHSTVTVFCAAIPVATSRSLMV